MTKIEWTDEIWNPVTGCTKVSAGCKNCYAERMAIRLWGERKFTDIRVHPERLKAPRHWQRPRRVFVNSMSDLFHESIPDSFIDSVFETMARCPQHTFQILTKRADRMWAYSIAESYRYLPNVWLGISCEDRESYLKRIGALMHTQAAIRFISFEPLLESIDNLMLDGIYSGTFEWAIIGGESGPNARPFNVEWARSIIAQCRAANVPVFMKQVGSDPVVFDVKTVRHKESIRLYSRRAHLKSRKGGDPKEWPSDLRIREYPK